MQIKLYVIPGSHPCACVEAALALKQIPYRRVDTLPVISRAHMRVLFRASSRVPAITMDGERLQGSCAILRRLDALAPEPPLLPADATLRARVEEAERWGEQELQVAARRLAWGVLSRRPRAMRAYAEGARLPLPTDLAMVGAGAVAWAASRVNGATDERVRGDLAALPGWLDRVDGWIADGVLGGATPNVADLQIGSSIALLRSFGDLRPLIAGRPCERLATAWFGFVPGEAPAGVLPVAWLPAARA